MYFSSLQPLPGANPRKSLITFFCVPSFELQYVSGEDILISYAYVRDDHLPEGLPLLEWKCDDFVSHMCTLNAELDVSAHGCLPVTEPHVRACGLHWAALGDQTLLLVAPGLGFTFAHSDDE